jgi:ribonucleoside-diphosphate reductase alpha chain
MAQLGIRYGSVKSARFAGEVMRTIAFAAYETSAQLAEERGAFPDYDEKKFWSTDSFACQRFKGTPLFGRALRNGVLLTIAPVGTGSIAYGNIDSAVEPIWALEYPRNVRQRDGSYKKHQTQSMTARLWKHLKGDEPYPRYINTAADLKVHEHIIVQEACQQWVDASISKTINIPTDMPYEDFVQVYDMAYEAGLKGCTTYRPSDVRGSILVTDEGTETPKIIEPLTIDKIQRPKYLQAVVAKVRWPAMSSAAYVHLSRLEDGSPFELFLTSKDQRNAEWMTTATLMASWLLRLGVPLRKIAEELKKVESHDGYLVDRRFRPSFVSLVGDTLLDIDDIHEGKVPEPQSTSAASGSAEMAPTGPKCPKCRSPNFKYEGGCLTCQDCGESKCG